MGKLFQLFFVVVVFVKARLPDEVDFADDVEVKTVDDVETSTRIVLLSAKYCSSRRTNVKLFHFFKTKILNFLLSPEVIEVDFTASVGGWKGHLGKYKVVPVLFSVQRITYNC